MTLRPVPKPERRQKRRRVRNSTLPYPSARLPRVNRRRRKKRAAAGLVYGPHYHWAKSSGPCLLAGSPGHTCTGPIDAHHVETVGHGGVDANNVVRLCRGAHRLSELSVHRMGRNSFEAYWHVDLQYEASAVWVLSPHSTRAPG